MGWNKTNENKHQFHMFITRNFQFTLNQWIRKENTTPKLSFYLHFAAKMALNAKQIVTRPIGKMKNMLKSVGFKEIACDKKQQSSDKIGQDNFERFCAIQSVNDWLFSSKSSNPCTHCFK